MPGIKAQNVLLVLILKFRTDIAIGTRCQFNISMNLPLSRRFLLKQTESNRPDLLGPTLLFSVCFCELAFLLKAAANVQPFFNSARKKLNFFLILLFWSLSFRLRLQTYNLFSLRNKQFSKTFSENFSAFSADSRWPHSSTAKAVLLSLKADANIRPLLVSASPESK